MKAFLRSNAVGIIVVLVTLALLVGFLLPVITCGTTDRGFRRTDAKATAISAAGAIRAYFIEYDKYPPMDQSEPTADMSTDEAKPKGNANLFYVLRGIDAGINANHAANPRKIVFFEGKNVSEPSNPKNGFCTTGASKGELMDPWGHPYVIVLDYDYSKSLDNLKYSDFSADDTKPRIGVGVYSLGKDGVLGENGAYRSEGKVSDDVISWQ